MPGRRLKCPMEGCGKPYNSTVMHQHFRASHPELSDEDRALLFQKAEEEADKVTEQLGGGRVEGLEVGEGKKLLGGGNPPGPKDTQGKRQGTVEESILKEPDANEILTQVMDFDAVKIQLGKKYEDVVTLLEGEMQINREGIPPTDIEARIYQVVKDRDKARTVTEWYLATFKKAQDMWNDHVSHQRELDNQRYWNQKYGGKGSGRAPLTPFVGSETDRGEETGGYRGDGTQIQGTERVRPREPDHRDQELKELRARLDDRDRRDEERERLQEKKDIEARHQQELKEREERHQKDLVEMERRSEERMAAQVATLQAQIQAQAVQPKASSNDKSDGFKEIILTMKEKDLETRIQMEKDRRETQMQIAASKSQNDDKYMAMAMASKEAEIRRLEAADRPRGTGGTEIMMLKADLDEIKRGQQASGGLGNKISDTIQTMRDIKEAGAMFGMTEGAASKDEGTLRQLNAMLSTAVKGYAEIKGAVATPSGAARAPSKFNPVNSQEWHKKQEMLKTMPPNVKQVVESSAEMTDPNVSADELAQLAGAAEVEVRRNQELLVVRERMIEDAEKARAIAARAAEEAAIMKQRQELDAQKTQRMEAARKATMEAEARKKQEAEAHAEELEAKAEAEDQEQEKQKREAELKANAEAEKKAKAGAGPKSQQDLDLQVLERRGFIGPQGAPPGANPPSETPGSSPPRPKDPKKEARKYKEAKA